jgi:hypothetical protein
VIPAFFEVPVAPDAEEAREWLITELAKSPYQAAKPTLFDQIAKALHDWLNSLQIGAVEGPPALGLGILIVIIVAAIVLSIIIFGIPRLNRRSTGVGSLFGEDDARSSETVRRAAEAAAASGDFSTAIAEMFRSIGRGLSERTLVSTSPGTTAIGFASATGEVFPLYAERVTSAAHSFDEVRYLGRSGTAEQFAQVRALERDLRGLSVTLEPLPS